MNTIVQCSPRMKTCVSSISSLPCDHVASSEPAGHAPRMGKSGHRLKNCATPFHVLRQPSFRRVCMKDENIGQSTKHTQL